MSASAHSNSDAEIWKSFIGGYHTLEVDGKVVCVLGDPCRASHIAGEVNQGPYYDPVQNDKAIPWLTVNWFNISYGYSRVIPAFADRGEIKIVGNKAIYTFKGDVFYKGLAPIKNINVYLELEHVKGPYVRANYKMSNNLGDNEAHSFLLWKAY
jgi:hypothetical protein